MTARMKLQGFRNDMAEPGSVISGALDQGYMRYEIVDDAIREGTFWRAKEILQGRLASSSFDRELLLRYGEVLLAMHDDVEAGRILFCAGSRRPEHLEAIRLFLSKHPRTKPENFLAALPAMVRRQRHLATYLASAEFENCGWSEQALGNLRVGTDALPSETKGILSARVMSWLAIGFIIFALISVPVGMFTILRLVISVFR